MEMGAKMCVENRFVAVKGTAAQFLLDLPTIWPLGEFFEHEEIQNRFLERID
jgi:hypothetical protein